jgi:polyisoprenoid-binding protein YceI
MKFRVLFRSVLAGVVVAAAAWASVAAQSARPLAIANGELTINGSSNVHEWSTKTSALRLVKASIAADLTQADCLDQLAKPGVVESFEIAVPVMSLASGKDGLDKNLQKALNAAKYPDVIFRLAKIEQAAAGKGFTASGTLVIAGTEKNVTLAIDVRAANGRLSIKGQLPLVMTDYGITPPKAMLGMLKTDPKVVIAFETTLTAAAIVEAVNNQARAILATPVR